MDEELKLHSTHLKVIEPLPLAMFPVETIKSICEFFIVFSVTAKPEPSKTNALFAVSSASAALNEKPIEISPTTVRAIIIGAFNIEN